jgi:hypothetical protein
MAGPLGQPSNPGKLTMDTINISEEINGDRRCLLGTAALQFVAAIDGLGIHF